MAIALPKPANDKALERRKTGAKFRSMTDDMQQTVTDYLLQEWSPEQISGYLKTQGGERVSHETIYQFVLKDRNNGGEPYKQLRHAGKKRKNRNGVTDRQGSIKDRISIEERPKSIEKRTRIGHWSKSQRRFGDDCRSPVIDDSHSKSGQ